MGRSASLLFPRKVTSSPAREAGGIKNLSVEPDSLQSIIFLFNTGSLLPQTYKPQLFELPESGQYSTCPPRFSIALIVAVISSQRETFSRKLLPEASQAHISNRWLILFEGGTLTSPLSCAGLILTCSIFITYHIENFGQFRTIHLFNKTSANFFEQNHVDFSSLNFFISANGLD